MTEPMTPAQIAAMVKRLRGITLTANITEVTRDAADALATIPREARK